MDNNIEGNNEGFDEVDETMDANVDQASGDGPPKKKKKKNSWIWNHFTCRISEIDSHEYAHCNCCNT